MDEKKMNNRKNDKWKALKNDKIGQMQKWTNGWKMENP